MKLPIVKLLDAEYVKEELEKFIKKNLCPYSVKLNVKEEEFSDKD